jgi:hypothetical protein
MQPGFAIGWISMALARITLSVAMLFSEVGFKSGDLTVQQIRHCRFGP